MKKVVILGRFLDKDDHKTWYEVGSEVEFEDDERVRGLIEKGWVKEAVKMATMADVNAAVDVEKKRADTAEKKNAKAIADEKTRADGAYQPKGDYLTKEAADAAYQPKDV